MRARLSPPEEASHRPFVRHLCEHVFVPTDATILHADLDAFYASVEQRDHPHLRGRPIVVGHGVVLAASYEAKGQGVRTAMSGYQARVACPDVIAVDAHFAAYTAASRAVFEIFRQTTPLVEGISVDEAFLDVSGLQRISGSARDVAERLRQRVAAEVGLPITVGGATSKFLAKVASAYAKPDGLLIVAPGQELTFLRPLAVERLWGVGKVTSVKLRACGIGTVGELADTPESMLSSMLGPATARHLRALAHGRDPRRVVVGRRRASIGSQCAMGRGPHRPAEIDEILLGLVDRVTRRMRAADRRGRTVVLRLRFDDFGRATRSHTLPYHTAGTEAVLAAARELLAQARSLVDLRGMSMVGVAVTNFGDLEAEQPELPFGEAPAGRRRVPARPGALDSALDLVKQRYGGTAITRAVHLGGRTGPDMPLLPD